MSVERLLQCEFLIPLTGDSALSTADAHSATEWEWLTDRVWVDFGGGTVSQTFYEGFYTDPDTGQRVVDRSRKFIVAVPVNRLEALRRLLAECCSVFRQKMIYLSIAGTVEYVRPQEE